MDRSAKKIAALQKLWVLYCSIYARKGLDISFLLTNLSEQKRQLAKQYGAEDCFDGLCECGCQPKPLAIAMMIFQPLRSFERKWKQITGTPRQREQKIRAMEKAATALEEVLSTLADVIIEHHNPGPSNLDSLKSIRRDLMSPPDNGLMWAMATTVADPATTIHALREYASLLKLCDLSQTDSGLGSADAFAKYFFRPTFTEPQINFTTRRCQP